jgi:multidrug resistance efflux pump
VLFELDDAEPRAALRLAQAEVKAPKPRCARRSSSFPALKAWQQQRHQPSRRGQRPDAARRRRAALEQAKARSTPATSP